MDLRKLIKLGDIVELSNGKVYIYTKCFECSESSNGTILARSLSYFASGLDNFNNNLIYKDSFIDLKIIKIFKPLKTPLLKLSDWHIDDLKYQSYIRHSIEFYPNNCFRNESNFLNLLDYV